MSDLSGRGGGNMKEISMEWAEDHHACLEAREWFEDELSGEASMPASKLFSRLEEIDRLDWASWLVVRLMTHEQQIAYAIYAAEQVIGIYEAKYPDDTRPRDAIQAAKAYLKEPTKANKADAAFAADAAYAAARAAHATHAAAFAADAAYAAAFAAYAAARAADAAAFAADAAAFAAYAAARAVDAAYAMQLKILNYGLRLIGVSAAKKAVEEGIWKL